MKRFHSILFALTLILGFLVTTPDLALNPTPAFATAISVTTTTDELNSDGDCSLREAIKAANTNLAVDACPAGSNAVTDTITLVSFTTYPMAIGGSGEDGNATGDYDLLNNNAAIDLIINTTSTRAATID